MHKINLGLHENWFWAVPADGCITVFILGIVILVITFSKLPDLLVKQNPF